MTYCADPARRKLFICGGCKVRHLRRCEEDRWNFTDADNLPGKPVVWPIYVEKGGQLWGFCPAKATWDEEAKAVFRLLIVAAETGMMLYSGGMLDQPTWFIDLLAWFLPRFDDIKFTMKAMRILGPAKPSGGSVGSKHK